MANERRTTPIGLQLYTVNAFVLKDAPATLRAVASIGYEEVETAGYGSLGSASDFRKALDDVGLRCSSAHLQFDLKNLDRAFDDANELGCTYATTSVPRMLLWPPVHDLYSMPPDELIPLATKICSPMTRDEFMNIAEVLNQIGKAAKAAGLKFAAHNHTMELEPLGDQTGLDFLIGSTDRELVDFELDLGWSAIRGFSPASWIDRYPGRIKLLHFRDFAPYTKAEPITFLNADSMELGQGTINYQSMAANLAGKGIEHIFVEQDGPFVRMSALEAIKFNFNYLKSLNL